MSFAINSIDAFEILDSRGNPTLRVGSRADLEGLGASG
jgi:enolase